MAWYICPPPSSVSPNLSNEETQIQCSRRLSIAVSPRGKEQTSLAYTCSLHGTCRSPSEGTQLPCLAPSATSTAYLPSATQQPRTDETWLCNKRRKSQGMSCIQKTRPTVEAMEIQIITPGWLRVFSVISWVLSMSWVPN